MFSTLLILAAATAANQSADPLAPARAGKYQCVMPNQEKKTCVATTEYKVDGDSYQATTRLLLAPKPQITMETRTQGAVKNGQICETIRAEDFETSKVYMDGKPAAEEAAAAVRSQLMAAVAPFVGKTSCTMIKPAEGGLMLNEISIDGTLRPDLHQKFLWVSGKDGYKLGN